MIQSNVSKIENADPTKAETGHLKEVVKNSFIV